MRVKKIAVATSRRITNALISQLEFTHISLADFISDIGKQNSPRWDAAKSGDILFAFLKK